MSNIQEIKSIALLEQKLSAPEILRYNSFKNSRRKLQFLLAHSIIRDVCGENAKIDKNGAPKIKSGFVSIAHKDNWVMVAVSDCNVGVDIENFDIERDFIGESELLNLPYPIDKTDFYKNFTQYEARIKFGKNAENIKSRFYKFDNYLICVLSAKKNIKFINADDLSPFSGVKFSK